jgi:hypothetical protein
LGSAYQPGGGDIDCNAPAFPITCRLYLCGEDPRLKIRRILRKLNTLDRISDFSGVLIFRLLLILDGIKNISVS